MSRQLLAGTHFAFVGLLVGYLLASELTAYWLVRSVEYLYLLRNAVDLPTRHPELSAYVAIILAATTIGGAAFGAANASERLTKEGTSDWQSRRALRRNGHLGQPGAGFILAKLTAPWRRGQFIASRAFPNALLVAPTGAGKGTGFVIPNLLTFSGSVVVLDVKGENFNATARHRLHAKGNKVFKFAPVEFGQVTHRYNPLERISRLNDYSRVNFELRKIATLFLQAEQAGEWLQGAIQLFVAIGGLAYEREKMTLGDIYKILTEGEGDLKDRLREMAQEASAEGLRVELSALAMLENKTLTSYQSVLNNAGFDKWSNDHVCEATSESDFSFADLRRDPMSVYFVMKFPDIEPMAPLVRLFFNELVATLQSHEPGKDEPHEVMIILDEFHLLGRMSAIADAMTTIRSFGGRIAIITQTIAKLDAIYSREERLSIQGNAGIKMYMTPSEEMTIEDLSSAVGMTTKRTVNKSRQAGFGERTTFSERTEERPLLTLDDARRLPKAISILIPNGQQPIKAKGIVYFKDRIFKKLMKRQSSMSWADLGGPHDGDDPEGAAPVAEARPTVPPRLLGQMKKQPLAELPEPESLTLALPHPEAFTNEGKSTQTPPRTEADLKAAQDVATRAVDLHDDVKTLPAKNAKADAAPAIINDQAPTPPRRPRGRKSRCVPNRDLPDHLKPDT